MPKPPGK